MIQRVAEGSSCVQSLRKLLRSCDVMGSESSSDISSYLARITFTNISIVLCAHHSHGRRLVLSCVLRPHSVPSPTATTEGKWRRSSCEPAGHRKKGGQAAAAAGKHKGNARDHKREVVNGEEDLGGECVPAVAVRSSARAFGITLLQHARMDDADRGVFGRHAKQRHHCDGHSFEVSAGTHAGGYMGYPSEKFKSDMLVLCCPRT